MYVRRDGCGRYVPRWISLWRSSRLGSRSASKSCHVTPSTPGAALRLSARNAVRSVSALRWWRSAVNRSFFLCLAACRTRLSAWVTRFRLWVRCVLCWSAFPLAPALGSTASATGSPALFGGFTATMAESDFSKSCIGDYGSSPSHRGPSAQYSLRPIRRPPGSRTRSVRACQVLRPRRVGQVLALALLDILPSTTQTVSAPGISFLSRLNGWPARSPTDASPTSSRMPAHGLGPMWVATPSSQWTCTTYSLPVSRRTCVKTHYLDETSNPIALRMAY